VLEEVLDLLAGELGDVVDVLDVVPARVAGRHADDLRVAAAVVGHVENAHGAHLHADAGEERVVEEHEHVQRVAVVAEGVLEEAVVGRVLERGVEHAVEEHPAGLVVDLVLVAAPLRDLDDRGVFAHTDSPCSGSCGSLGRSRPLGSAARSAE
jgi:hypothetical protein